MEGQENQCIDLYPFFLLLFVSLLVCSKTGDRNSSPLPEFEPQGCLGVVHHSLLIFPCRVFSQCFLRATQHGWDRNSGWLLSTCQSRLAFPLLSADHGFSSFGHNTHSPYTLCHCKKSQNRSSQAFSSSPLCPRFFKPFLLVRISDCRWVDRTQCLGGGSGDSSPTRLILGSTCLLCRDFTSCLPESVLGSANSNLLSLVTFFLLFDFSFSSFSPPHPQNGQGVWLVQSWRELMVTDIGQQQSAHGLWLSVRQRQSELFQSAGGIATANFGIAFKRPWVGWCLDWSVWCCTPLTLVLSEDPFRERILVFSSLDSDFQASWLLPWHTPTWLDKGSPMAWERNLFLIFLSYKNGFFPINIFTSED